jgi:hypothetical protein
MSTASTAGRPTTIDDAGPTVAATTLSGAEQRVFAACKAFSAAADAVERHSGPRAGEGYDEKMKTWREAYASWRQAMLAFARASKGEAA